MNPGPWLRNLQWVQPGERYKPGLLARWWIAACATIPDKMERFARYAALAVVTLVIGALSAWLLIWMFAAGSLTLFGEWLHKDWRKTGSGYLKAAVNLTALLLYAGALWLIYEAASRSDSHLLKLVVFGPFTD